MRVWVVPYVYDGGLQGVVVFDTEEKAQEFADYLHKRYDKRNLDMFIQHIKVL